MSAAVRQRSVNALVAKVREATPFGRFSHQTKRVIHTGENNYWEVDEHDPEGCLGCEGEAALKELARRARRAVVSGGERNEAT